MDIQQVKEKFRKLIALNPNGEYGYINGPIPETEILEFEAKHHIRLPEDYRAFITQMFDGGVGRYQIMPLQFWDSTHNAVYLDSLGNKLSEPFLLTNNWEYDFNDEREDDESYEYHSIINGTIRLCHIGCGNFLFLVVNGEEYGNIWIDDRASNSKIVPLLDRDTNGRVTFEKWYNDWLDEEIEVHEKRYKASRKRRGLTTTLPYERATEPDEKEVEQVRSEEKKIEEFNLETNQKAPRKITFWTILKSWLT